jgi:hypothetical protein
MRPLIGLALVLLALFPSAVFAHGGAGHGDEPKALGGDEVRSGSPVERQDWSPVCPPGSGHACGCGNLSLCDGGAKPALVFGSGVSLLPPRIGGVAPPSVAPACAAPRFPQSLPRAPPHFS